MGPTWVLSVPAGPPCWPHKLCYQGWSVVTPLIAAYIQATDAGPPDTKDTPSNNLLPRKVNRQPVSQSERICYISGCHDSYINTYTMTNLSQDNSQNWAYGEHKRKHWYETHAVVQKNKLPLSYMSQQSCFVVSSTSIHFAKLWIVYGSTNW